MSAVEILRVTRLAHRFGLSLAQAAALSVHVWEAGRAD